MARIAAGAELAATEVQELAHAVQALAARTDRLNLAIAELRELLIAADLPESAEDSREEALDILDEIALACADHDITERDRLYPQAAALDSSAPHRIDVD